MTLIKQLAEEAAREWGDALTTFYSTPNKNGPILVDFIARALEKQKAEFEAELRASQLGERLHKVRAEQAESRIIALAGDVEELTKALEQAEAAHDRAVAETVERCAKIPDEWVNSSSCKEDGASCEHQRLACAIAERIRSLAPKVEKEATITRVTIDGKSTEQDPPVVIHSGDDVLVDMITGRISVQPVSVPREHKAITLLREWMQTELDPQDEDYDQWMQSFTDRVNDVLAAAGAKT